MLEETEGAIKYVQSRETINIGYTRRRQTKNNTKTQKDEQQSNGYKGEPNILIMRKSYRTSQHGTHKIRTPNSTT